MSSDITGALIGAIAAFSVGLLTLGYQIWQKRAEDRAHERDEVKRRKLSIVSDLVAYRYAITNDERASPSDISRFNATLCRIPIEFIDDFKVIDIYRELGTDFNGAKLVRLVNAMVKAADQSKTMFDFNTLFNVPSVRMKPMSINLEGISVEHIAGEVRHDAPFPFPRRP